MTVPDVIRLKYNTRMLLAERVRPELLEAVRAADNPSDELRAGAAAIEAWDGTVGAQSEAPCCSRRSGTRTRTRFASHLRSDGIR